MEHQRAALRPRPMTPSPPPLRRLLSLLLAVVVAGACAADVEPTPSGLPGLTCGGINVAIDPALPCERVADIALQALRDRAPKQIARGVTAIDVVLSQCPRGEVPPQIACGNAQFAQMVTVTFGPGGNGRPIEPSLTVAVEPTTGAVLGISNPLIR